jgi:hypothetical protein
MENKRTAKIGLIQVTSDYGWTVEQCLDEMLRRSGAIYTRAATDGTNYPRSLQALNP